MPVANYIKNRFQIFRVIKTIRKGKIMETKKMKTLPVREEIHTQISGCAKDRGMTIQGLTERIIRAWLDENFFDKNIASSNKNDKKEVPA